MKLVVTAKIKPKSFSLEDLIATTVFYIEAFNFTCQIDFNDKDRGGIGNS